MEYLLISYSTCWFIWVFRVYWNILKYAGHICFAFIFWTFYCQLNFIWSKWTHCSERDPLKCHWIAIWRFYLIRYLIPHSQSSFTRSFSPLLRNPQFWKKGGVASHRVRIICIGFSDCNDSFYFSFCQAGKGDSLLRSRFI